MAGAAGDLDDALPGDWVEHASGRAGEPVPTTFSEPSLEPTAADAEARSVTASVADILWG
jgi:hypothetical protein